MSLSVLVQYHQDTTVSVCTGAVPRERERSIERPTHTQKYRERDLLPSDTSVCTVCVAGACVYDSTHWRCLWSAGLWLRLPGTVHHDKPCLQVEVGALCEASTGFNL